MINEELLIRKFKNYFKGKKLREISVMTGLSISRVFRILNGSKLTYQEGHLLNQIMGENSNGIDGLLINKNNVVHIKKKLKKLIRLEKIIGMGGDL